MSSDMKISGDSMRSPGVERIPASPRVQTPPSQPENHSSVQTVDDLKRAELSGTNIPVSEEQLIRAIERAIHAIQGKTTSLEFSVHEKTKQIMVKVKDSNTGEVIREIPPEKTLDFVAKLWEMAGLFVDERR